MVVAFSAGAISRLAEHGIVVADHDRYSCPQCKWRWDGEWEQQNACPKCGGEQVTEPAGERHARRTQLPWWMPPEPDMDANDLVNTEGLDALTDALRKLVTT